MIREQPHYRRDAFMAGLRAAGFDARTGSAATCEPGDVVLMWNRYGENDELADRVERAGGTVLVAENGYVGRGGLSPKSVSGPGNQYYAVARHAHNGRGNWPYANGTAPGWRWAALGIELAPWRVDGEHILVCANRSFGMRGGIMPVDWLGKTEARLRRVIRRPIRLRQHPAGSAPRVALADDLANAWACVIWSSSCGVHALIAGVPVICQAPWWIAKRAAGHSLEELAAPYMPERLPVLQRLAWAQWTVEEIATGDPFRYLLSDSGQAQSAAAV